MQNKTYIFIGRSGCGKGTQIDLLSKKLKEDSSEISIKYISTGQVLRDFWKEKGYSNILSKKIMENGDLQPEFLVVYLWGKNLIKDIKGKEHLIFDGTPRRLNEAEVLDSAIKFYQRKEPVVIFINVSREWSVKRLLGRGRSDDSLEQINKRLDWFDKEVIPALNYLKNDSLYKFVEVNGEQTIEKVFEELKQKI